MAILLASARGLPHRLLQCRASAFPKYSRLSIRLTPIRHRLSSSHAGKFCKNGWPWYRWLMDSQSLGSESSYGRRNGFGRVLKFTAISIFFTSAGFLIATAPAIASVVSLMSTPSDAESVTMFRTSDEIVASVNDCLANHPLAKRLRADPTWTESRPHLRYPEEHKKHSLTAGTLLGPGRMVAPPLVFTDDKHLVSLAYLGTDLCGHVGIVHGGFLATMMDEGLARCGFTSLPNHIGVTATLTISYRKPTPAGSFVVLKAETTKVDGRKVWVKGRLEKLGDADQPGEVLAEAEGLFIEPKYARMLPRIFQVQKS